MRFKVRIITRCLLCQHSAAHAIPNCCAACFELLPWNRSRCSRCALPLPQSQSVCGRCLADMPPFTASVVPFIYCAPIDRLINEFKHRANLLVLPLIAQALEHAINTRRENTPDLLVPVPLHRYRHVRRGFNQAELLAREVGKRLNVQLNLSLVTKTHQTALQQELSLKQRRKNLRGSFAVLQALEGKEIALLDDVITTGATAREIASELINAGAKSVRVWGVARTPLN